MKLLAIHELPDDPSTETFRSSRMVPVIYCIVLLAMDVGMVWMLVDSFRKGDKQGVFFAGIMLAGWSLFLLLMLAMLRAAFRPTNWLVRMTSTALLVHLRSYLNWEYADDTPCVAAIELSEIESVNLFTQKLVSPARLSGGGGVRVEVIYSLQVHLRHDDTAALADALRFEQSRPGYGGRIMTSKNLDYPVTLREPAMLNIRFATKHAARRVLRSLEGRVNIGDPQRAAPGSPLNQLKDKELEERILQLCEAGDELGAIALARQRYGYTLTQAKDFVDDLTARPPANRPA